MGRECGFGDDAFAGLFAQVEGGGVAVEEAKAVAEVAQADGGGGGGGVEVAGAGDAQAELVGGERDRVGDLAAGLAGGGAELHGVLDDALQEHGRDEGAVELCGNIGDNGEAVAEAEFLELEVAADDLELLGEGDDEVLGVGEGIAQEAGKLGERLGGARGVDGDEGAQGVEAVEEEGGLTWARRARSWASRAVARASAWSSSRRRTRSR